MASPLDSLEQKIDQVLALCRTLSDENRQLREQVAAGESENQALRAKIDQACLKIEDLMANLPES